MMNIGQILFVGRALFFFIGTLFCTHWASFYLDFFEEIPSCGRRLGGLASSGADD